MDGVFPPSFTLAPTSSPSVLLHMVSPCCHLLFRMFGHPLNLPFYTWCRHAAICCFVCFNKSCNFIGGDDNWTVFSPLICLFPSYLSAHMLPLTFSPPVLCTPMVSSCCCHPSIGSSRSGCRYLPWFGLFPSPFPRTCSSS